MCTKNKYWSDAIKSLKPYVPGEQVKGRDVVRLNTNENPYPPSPEVTKTLLNYINNDVQRLRLYPSFDMQELKITLADYHNIEPEQVFIGNGSDEVLGHVFNALFRHTQPLLMPDISYSFYPVYSNLFGIDMKMIPLRDDFSLYVDDYLKPENRANGGIIIANPNAPTGSAISVDEIQKLLQGNQQSAVVIDEAYVDYGAQTVIPYIKEYKNLLVIRTFSKSRSLAGLRIGYAVGDASLIDALNCVKDSFNSFPVGSLAQIAAVASVKDNAYFEKCRLEVIESRKWLQSRLQALQFIVLPSASNFLFASPTTHSAAYIQEQLREKDILVRYFKQARIDRFLRISIGTQKECELLITALHEIML